MFGLIRRSRIAHIERDAENARVALASNREAWARLAESYREQLARLTVAYAALCNEHNKTLDGDYEEAYMREFRAPWTP